TQHPAYLKLLQWIRSASGSAAADSHSDWRAYADSYSPDHPPMLAIDGDLGTSWHTEYIGAQPGYPHEFTIDLGRSRKVSGLSYVPRSDGNTNGRVKKYEVYLSDDGSEWGKPLASGTWANDGTTKFVPMRPNRARYIKLRGLSEVNNLPY